MLTSKIALVDQTKKIQPRHLAAVAAAIQTQVTRDLSQFWPVSATVTTMDPADQIPLDVWPVYIVATLPAGEGGYHWITDTKQPYSVVLNGPGWTVATSHEICEMLVDPQGSRLQAARKMEINGNTLSLDTSQVYYLVEVCDPCESHGYTIDGVAVSDFITPAYYHDGSGAGRYDFMGRIKTPLDILPGGYISWMDQATKDMMQITWLDGSQPPQLANLGTATGVASLKEHVDSKTGTIPKIAASSDHEAVKLATAMGVWV